MTAWQTRRIWFAGDNWGPITQDEFPLKRYFPTDAKPELNRNADVLFVNDSVKSLREFRQLRRQNQVRIFCATEAIAPDFNIFDYALGFDHISFGDRYVRMHPLMLYQDYRAQMDRQMDESGFCSTHTLGSREFCNFVYSNPNGHPFRAEFFQALSTYRRVDSFGNFLNNMGEIHRRKSSNSSWRQVAIELNSRYRFSIAIENAKHAGYTSEKLLAAFIGGGVPLYWGNEEVGVDFCQRRFLNLHTFDSLDAAVFAVRELDRDPDKYAEVISSPIMDLPQIEYLHSQESKLRIAIASLFSHELEGLQRRGFGTAQSIYERDFFRRLELESRLKSFSYPMYRLLRR